MSAVIGDNQYGKSRIRIAKVTRDGTTHRFRELTVDILLRGDFVTAHTKGDNSKVLPTDTMKNSVYGLAQKHPIESLESFATHLAQHFVDETASVSSATVGIREIIWDRHTQQGKAHPHTFVRRTGECNLAEATYDGNRTTVRSGIDGLAVLKTAISGFVGYLKDPYTILRETTDRVLGTSITAWWSYSKTVPADGDALRRRVRDNLLGVFCEHPSKSVQHTLHAMGEAVLAACPEIADISMALPNLHYLNVDLSPFGQPNDNTILLPIDEPHGQIEATVKRG